MRRAIRWPCLLRLVGRPLVAAGLDVTVAACAIAALCAALSAVLVFKIAREIGVGRCLSYGLTALWAFSTTALLLGVLPEAYDLTLVALAWQFLLAVRWMAGSEPKPAMRVAAGVVNFGITVTNVVLAGLCELVCRLARQSTRQAVLGTAGFSVTVAVVGIILSAASFHIWPVKGVDSSAGAVKQLYWDASSAERTVERQSVAQVAWTFGATAFVAPAAARFASGEPDNPYLWTCGDRITLAWAGPRWRGWLALLAFGAVAAARDRRLRPVWVIALLWIAANIALHSYWQFRDAIFLYAAHSHIAFFMLVLAGAKWAQERKSAFAYCTVVALVTVLVAFNNMPLYLALPWLD